ncbi:MAG: glycosyltransferase family 2 protein [Chlorobi bacterium]|nr:glycosyltransferase family 2 protein [Chlorobiota bacterium]
MVSLSVIIITHNEEENLPHCLASVRDIADEIVVVDDFSTDGTMKICREFGVRVVLHKFEGHIEQKNFALTQASFPYVLSLDADEEVSKTLYQSISAIKENWRYDGYCFNRLNIYCGTPIKHGGWYPDKKLRLFDKRKARWGGINPHDMVILKPGSKTKKLKGDLLHYSYASTTEHIFKVNRYTDIFSTAYVRQGRKAGFLHIVFNPTWKFIRNYFLRLGFLDGSKGLSICVIQAYETFLKYSKINVLLKNGVDYPPGFRSMKSPELSVSKESLIAH